MTKRPQYFSVNNSKTCEKKMYLRKTKRGLIYIEVSSIVKLLNSAWIYYRKALN